jgi:hypothetical protein
MRAPKGVCVSVCVEMRAPKGVCVSVCVEMRAPKQSCRVLLQGVADCGAVIHAVSIRYSAYADAC